MPTYKRFAILLILSSIALIYIYNTVIDLSRLINYNFLYSASSNELVKRINVLLAALLVWLAGKDSINYRDNLLMKYVFLAIGCGEVFFLLGKPAMAIGFFMVCQCMLIARHSRGLLHKLSKASFTQYLKLCLAAFILTAFLFIAYPLLISIAPEDIPLYLGIPYGIILSFSLWTGLANDILGLYPYKNAKMIALGMLCFFCCDILVGLDGLLEYGLAWIIASSLIWVFYTPAITLLALSSYRYTAKPYSSATIANI